MFKCGMSFAFELCAFIRSMTKLYEIWVSAISVALQEFGNGDIGKQELKKIIIKNKIKR